jgi:methionyl-tRNA formyltransferase
MISRENFRIIFMGTPDFAVPSLEALHHAGYSIPAVVTVPDKPSGRGLKISESSVKRFANSHALPVLQPDKPDDSAFIESLTALHPDLFVVVAFRILPEAVWSLPSKGTINLHASLLPQFRGAAPINHAIIRGESKTGLTTFFIDHKVDTGKLIMQSETDITPDMTAGELHDILMMEGSRLLLQTVDAIRSGNVSAVDQKTLIKKETVLYTAPRIFKHHCKIDWNASAESIHNLIRGLSPYPAAFATLLSQEGKSMQLKIFRSCIDGEMPNPGPGKLLIIGKKRLFIGTSDQALELLELQLAGKSRTKISDFLNGANIDETWRAH